MPDIQRPTDDPFALIGDTWPAESETAYTAAETAAGDASTTASTQSAAADDAARETREGMKGRTADAVSDGYSHVADQLRTQSTDVATIAAWMLDASGKVSKAKNNIASLVMTGTSEIRDALDSELQGTPASPSSTELTDKYRGDIASVASKLTTDLDAIGHSLAGTPGSSTTPSYISVPVSSSEQHPHHGGVEQVTKFNHGDQPEVIPQQLPEMPRVTTTQPDESTSRASTPTAPAVATPHSVNPTLSNLISGSGSPSASSPGGMGSPHASSQGSPSTPSPQSHQSTERHQQPKLAGLPHIPSIPLDGLPAAAAESITTAVSSAVGHQLSTAPSTTSTQSVPVSTGITPGVPGTPPMAPVTPTPLTPIGGGGGLTPPAVTQPAAPAPQATPASPTTPSPTPTRSPAADLSWIQRTYGLAPGIETPKPESVSLSAIFITDLPDSEAHLHRALASLRQAFEQSGWAQPLAVATIKRGFERLTVYVTSDAQSIHPQGVSLPSGVTPLDESPSVPDRSDLSGSLMVSEKLKSLIPRGWEVESMLSTVPGGENSQSVEQYQELVQGEELLPCKGSRGRDGVEAGEAMSVFARAAIGSAGCSELDTESSRLRAARWVGVQPAQYGEVLARWHLADAAESMSRGAWGEAVYCSEKYMSVQHPRSQAA